MKALGNSGTPYEFEPYKFQITNTAQMGRFEVQANSLSGQNLALKICFASLILKLWRKGSRRHASGLPVSSP